MAETRHLTREIMFDISAEALMEAIPVGHPQRGRDPRTGMTPGELEQALCYAQETVRRLKKGRFLAVDPKETNTEVEAALRLELEDVRRQLGLRNVQLEHADRRIEAANLLVRAGHDLIASIAKAIGYDLEADQDGGAQIDIAVKRRVNELETLRDNLAEELVRARKERDGALKRALDVTPEDLEAAVFRDDHPDELPDGILRQARRASLGKILVELRRRAGHEEQDRADRHRLVDALNAIRKSIGLGWTYANDALPDTAKDVEKYVREAAAREARFVEALRTVRDVCGQSERVIEFVKVIIASPSGAGRALLERLDTANVLLSIGVRAERRLVDVGGGEQAGATWYSCCGQLFVGEPFPNHQHEEKCAFARGYAAWRKATR